MKTYLSRSLSRFWSAEFPVGDPFGGPAYGEKNDPGTILAGAQVVGGLMGSDSASSAGDAQVQAAQKASDTQLQMFNTVNGQQAPYRQIGYNALNAITRGFGGTPTQYNSNGAAYTGAAPASAPATKPASTGGGSWQMQQMPNAAVGDISPVWVPDTAGAVQQQVPGSVGGYSGTDQTGFNGTDQTGFTGIGSGQFTHQFDANDLNANLAPNYKFMLDQGLGATTNAASVSGGLVGGNALKGINDYAQNYASNGYQQAYDNYNNNQNNIFNRLSAIAGLGQQSVTQSGNAATTAGGNIGSAQLAGGAAQAAGIVGSNNALTGGINNAAGSYYLRDMMKPGTVQDLNTYST